MTDKTEEEQKEMVRQARYAADLLNKMLDDARENNVSIYIMALSLLSAAVALATQCAPSLEDAKEFLESETKILWEKALNGKLWTDRV